MSFLAPFKTCKTVYFQLDADILNGGNTEEQIRETFFEVILKKYLGE